MRRPNLVEEKKLWKKGYKRVACLDESGRGPLAGPVVAAAVMLKSKVKTTYPPTTLSPRGRAPRQKSKVQVKSQKFLKEIRDSKKLSSKKREKLYKLLIRCPFIVWGRGRVSERMIDKINILEATKLAMKKAFKNLNCKLKIANLGEIDFLILDGKMKLDLDIPQKSIVKADEKVFSCSAASVIAKVARDRIMLRYHQKYPQYGFDKHKGYPTKRHLKMLKKCGPCKIHRKSFKPVKNC